MEGVMKGDVFFFPIFEGIMAQAALTPTTPNFDHP
jgi:hypothetical protein